LEGIVSLDRKAFIIAKLVATFNFENRSQEYHATEILEHFNAIKEPVTLDEIKHSLCESSFQKVLTFYGVECSTHRNKLHDVPAFGPTKGRRIKYSFGGICSKVSAYEFPGINESISCHYDNDEKIKAITRKLLLSTILEKTPNPTVGTKRSFENISVETKDTEIKSKKDTVTERKRKYSSISTSSFEHVCRDVSSTGTGRLTPSGRVEPEKVQNTSRNSSKSIEKKLKEVMGMLEIYPPEVSTGLISFFCDKENPNNRRACMIHECSKILEECAE
jgi:hypothetical protein